MTILTFERVRELFTYDPATGIFIWRVVPDHTRKCLVGQTAGSLLGDGYIYIRINKRLYAAHRLAWFYVHGTWPPNQTDHINLIQTDNRITNLRLATVSQNQANCGRRINNTSGFKGVSLHKPSQKWQASIQHMRVHRRLGFFDTPEAAYAAYCAAAKLLHGEFARLL